MIFIGIYTWLVVYLEYEFWHWDQDPFIKNLTTVQTLLGFVLSLLLVFRTNTAYDRWWEGRKLWGSLVNNSRTLSLKLNAILKRDDEKNRVYFQKGIALYAHSLKQHLRSHDIEVELDEEWNQISGQHHLPNQIAKRLIVRLYEMESNGEISGTTLFPFKLS